MWTSIEGGSSNVEGAVGIACGNAIDFFDFEMFPSTHPEQEFLEQANR